MTDYKRKAAAELAAERGIPGDTYVCGEYEAVRIRSLKDDDFVISWNGHHGGIQTREVGSLDLDEWVAIVDHEPIENTIWKVSARWEND